MNKKVILSVLSTALVTSMATSAYAADGGVYIGGNVDRYYSDKALIKQTHKFVADLYDSGLKNVENNVLYVNWDGEVATLQEMMVAKLAGKEVEYKTVTSKDFEKIGGEKGFYAVDAKGNVSTVKEMQPEQKSLTPEAIVTNATEFNIALQNPNVKTIILGTDIQGDITVARSIIIKGSGKKIIGDLKITNVDKNNVELSDVTVEGKTIVG
ncbi:pectate lyase-like adhesive domain-containing protein [Brevibacillus sp. VP]|uniref:pectate lyase-like adhesive domain-containing protein n=1 Tax=unclassified Brevibacillus TaxID=2684853 RepID=UPI000E2FCEF1|nr:pectate lyase-like adhesive domain-containing protein [Brevibacillus sp. VP]RFB28431.1 hypothetical protein DZB91_23290 [Brevibacillus sp. VP]